ncbi:MAG: FAD-binding oxidoreductase [Gammaproteobacteria bacterium]|nr:FAD-binding oxidoreductase [Gammaproteobacteria bacterium]
MIPGLPLDRQIKPEYLAFLQDLEGYEGEISSDYAGRLLMATDSSVYQILPQAVLYPRTEQDVAVIFELAAQKKHRNIRFSPRGGGTGTNGQSLNRGIIVDCSRHMNCILELNLQQGWVRVQPGVVLDQLNEYLKPHGVFFAPSLSPSNRATLGGMANTDACGKGSRIYGRTSNHVESLHIVFANGRIWEAGPMDQTVLAQVKAGKDIVAAVHRQLDKTVKEKKRRIAECFPKLSRFMSGYNLAHVYDKEGRFRLCAVLCGSEGTLAMVTELKLKLTPLPKFKHLLLLKYKSFDDALDDAGMLVQADPAAIETIDEKVLLLAKSDVIYRKVKNLVEDTDNRAVRGINLVEFVDDDKAHLDQKVRTLCRKLEQGTRAMAYCATDDPREMAALWELRKKGVGLLGKTKGERRPVSFVEDTAVPPQHLAAYIREFRKMLDSIGVSYGMFGHVDAGCLHVRPALDLRNEADEKLMRIISDKVKNLVLKYQGVMWGEHGKGFRSEYTPEFIGEELFQEMRKLKAAFDPYNQLNPGKICTPITCEEALVSVDDLKRGAFDRQIPAQVRAAYEATLNCNGNGACFNYNANSEMCPSYKVSRDRVRSPKGRAALMREWLRRMALAGADPLRESEKNRSCRFQPPWQATMLNSRRKRRGEYDYSHEVFASMDDCLACKACAVQCPVNVDVAQFRSRFLELYYSRYSRPARDYLMANIEHLASAMSRFPNLANRGLSLGEGLLDKFFGLTGLPRLNIVKDNAKCMDTTLNELKNLTHEEKARSVLLVQDAFTGFFDASVANDVLLLLKLLGFKVFVVPFKPSGKPLHVKGFLHRFKAVAADTANFLNAFAEIPLVGIEPSVTLCYRDEYIEFLGENRVRFNVQLLQEFLRARLDRFARPKNSFGLCCHSLLCHCSEKALAPSAEEDWLAVLAHFGIEAQAPSATCCGMAGTFGHERHHLADSKRIYQMSWQDSISVQEAERIMVTGYSCRSQVFRMAGFKPLHPAQVLLRAFMNVEST